MPHVDDYLRALRENPMPAGPDEALNESTLRTLQQHAHARFRGHKNVQLQRWVAAAAVIVGGVGLYSMRDSGGLESLALADVAQRALDTHTVVFQFREHWGTARAMIKVDCGLRIESDAGDMMIVDHRTHRMLMLNAHEHTARCVPPPAWTGFDLYTWFRDLPNDTSQRVGNDVIDGEAVVGFRVLAPVPASNGAQSADFIVWANPRTGLPVRIDGDEHPFAWDLCFDVPLDDRVFDLSMSEGYVLEPLYGVTNEPAVGERPTSSHAVRSVAIGRSVAEFTDGADFSTPEVAYANINRACVSATNNAWARVSASALRDAFPASDEPAYVVTPAAATMWLQAKIIEVLYCGDTKAAIVAHLTNPNGLDSYDLRRVTLEDGRWLNVGQDLFPTAEQARERFAKQCR